MVPDFTCTHDTLDLLKLWPCVEKLSCMQEEYRSGDGCRSKFIRYTVASLSVALPQAGIDTAHGTLGLGMDQILGRPVDTLSLVQDNIVYS